MAFTTPQGRTSTSLSEINVTPLVDVMLVLLIIFMVTAPMLQTGIVVELPDTRNAKDVNANGLIIITISRTGDLYYGSEPINYYSIPERLIKDAKSSNDPIFLGADKDVKWNYIVSVIDKIKGTKINGTSLKNVMLVTKALQEEKKQK
jgi:biopolymer transport protein TolR